MIIADIWLDFFFPALRATNTLFLILYTVHGDWRSCAAVIAVLLFGTGSQGRGCVLIPYRRLIYLTQGRQDSGASSRDGKTRRIMIVPSKAQLDTPRTRLCFLICSSGAVFCSRL